jgi:gamma-glutamylputrescine oxidase
MGVGSQWVERPVWADLAEPLGPLPPLEGHQEADACVVGLGGTGLSALGALVRRGLRAVGLDSALVAGGAAGRNGGFLLAGAADPYHRVVATLGRQRAVALYRATLEGLRAMAAETPESVALTGSLRVARSQEEALDCRRQREAMEADGFPVEPYEGPEGRGLLFPADGRFQPVARCRELARRLLAAGASLYERSPAVAVEGGRVTTARGSVICRFVLLATDGGLPRLVPAATGPGGVRSVRLQMLATAPAADRGWHRPVYARWGLDYWQQLPDGRVVLGGCRDMAGVEEYTEEQRITATVQGHLDRLLREELGVRSPVTHRWAGIVSYSDSGLPVLGQVSPGVWAAGAYNGTGNVIGMLCGKALVELAVDGRSELAEVLAGPAPAGR